MVRKYTHRSLALLGVMLLALFSAALQAEQALLWRVQSAEGAVSHLFGTIHSDDPRVTALPEPVEQAFTQSATVVLEVELNAEVQQRMAQSILLPPAHQLADYIPNDLYRASLAAMAERGYPAEITSRLRPWALVLTLSMPQPMTGEFLDKVLHDRALAERKQVRGLETVDEQMAIFSELSLADQQALLRQALADQEQLPQMMETMLVAWLERDLGALQSLYEENLAGLPAALQSRFGQRLVESRNRLMAERAVPLLRQGGAFIAVGAMHLPGEEGVVALLREAGMTVSPVY